MYFWGFLLSLLILYKLINHEELSSVMCVHSLWGVLVHDYFKIGGFPSGREVESVWTSQPLSLGDSEEGSGDCRLHQSAKELPLPGILHESRDWGWSGKKWGSQAWIQSMYEGGLEKAFSVLFVLNKIKWSFLRIETVSGSVSVSPPSPQQTILW